jgi:PAS domain S-box-containing protein
MMLTNGASKKTARDYKEPDSNPLENTGAMGNFLLWVSLIILLILIVAGVYFFQSGYMTNVMVIAAGLIPVFITIVLNSQGKHQTAGALLSISLILLITILATIGQGIHAIGLISYPVILIITGLFLRRDMIIYITALSIASVSWLVFGEMLGFYQPKVFENITVIEFLVVTAILVITAMGVQIYSKVIRENSVRLKRELDERKKAEIALGETEELYRNLIENTSVITYRDTAEEESSAIYISPQIFQLLGYSQTEWLSNPRFWAVVTHPDDREKVREMTKTCLETGAKTVIEYRMHSKDGKWFWFQDEAILKRTVEGEPLYIHGVLIDITNRKIAEQKLQQREAILNAVAQAAQLLLKSMNWRDEANAILQMLGEATGASHVYLFENLMGNDEVMLTSQKFEYVAPGIQSELNFAAYQNARLSPTTPGLEDWYTNLSEGKPFYGSGRQYPRYWEEVFESRGLKTLLDMPIFVNGMWWGIIGFDDFVNEMPWSQVEIDALAAAAGNLGAAIERQQAEQALRASEDKFQHAFHHTYVCMAISRTFDNTLLDVNDAFCKVTGFSREEAIGKRAGRDMHIWVRSEDRDFVIRTLEEQGFVDEYRASFKRKTGEIGIALLSAVNVTIAGEACQLFTFYDISRIDQLVNELKAKNEELQNFTYTVSHDLKAPLMTIAGFLGYLEQDARGGDIERLNKDVLRINEAVSKMGRLLNELLELSRIGRLMNEPQDIPFDEIVQEALKLVRGRLEARQVEVRVEADLPYVHGDRARLIEVIQNLVDNAAKFMGDQTNPLIEIGARREEDNWVFFVRDNGIGIGPDQHERIFGLFNKLDAQTDGTGIGLALVKRIIEVHGGRIWVESEGTGKGSTFNFTLSGRYERGT